MAYYTNNITTITMILTWSLKKSSKTNEIFFAARLKIFRI